MVTKADVEKFFAAYGNFYNEALAGDADMDAVEAFYSSAFVSVTPAGVMAGENDETLKKIMKKGFEGYKALGARKMTCAGVTVTAIDPGHCVARVQWSGDYERKNKDRVTIDFEISYLVEKRDGKLLVFGWIAGDEQAEFKKHGLL